MANNRNRRNNPANNGNYQQRHNQQQNNQAQNYQAQNGQNNPNNNIGNQGNNQQNNGQQVTRFSNISPNYKGKNPIGGYRYNSTNGSQNEQAGQQRQKQNDKSFSKMDPQQQALHASWLKKQDDQKRKMERETAELLQKEQRDFLACQFTPSAETILAFRTLRELFTMQMTRDLSQSEFNDRFQALQTMQLHFNQQPHQDQTIQPLLDALLGYIWTYPTIVITDSAVVDWLWTTIYDLETKLIMSISQHGDGGFEPLSQVRNDLQPPKMPSLTKSLFKQPEPTNEIYQTNVHVDDLLNKFDAWLRQNGVSALRVTSDTVYYQYAFAATEEEWKKELRFVDIAGHPGYVKLEGHDNINTDAAMLRAAEHAFIVWTAQNQAAEALSKAKEAEKRVLHNVARVHPEARKQLETFEKGLEMQRAQLVYREMQAQLNFEQQQREQFQKLNEGLEQRRREFLGIDAGEVRPTERAYLPKTNPSLTRADVIYASRPNYASRFFSGLESPAKFADTTISLAVKKPQDEKKKSFYPRFLHASRLFRVEKYEGDPRGDGHLEKDHEGEIVLCRPWTAPCVAGCRQCLKYEQSDVS